MRVSVHAGLYAYTHRLVKCNVCVRAHTIHSCMNAYTHMHATHSEYARIYTIRTYTRSYTHARYTHWSCLRMYPYTQACTHAQFLHVRMHPYTHTTHEDPYGAGDFGRYMVNTFALTVGSEAGKSRKPFLHLPPSTNGRG